MENAMVMRNIFSHSALLLAKYMLVSASLAVFIMLFIPLNAYSEQCGLTIIRQEVIRKFFLSEFVVAVVPLELQLRYILATHLISPNEKFDGMTILQAIFDQATAAPDPDALADIALAYGADIDAKDLDGQTALIAAANGGSGPTRYLLQHGANPNLEDNYGNTALLLADDRAGGRAFSISGLLLAAGADPCHKNHKGETPATHFGLDTPLGRMLDEVCRGKPAAK
jgi:hypothetical protein